MLLPVNATLGSGVRFSRLSASRHTGANGIKTISIPLAQTSAPAPMPEPVVEEVKEEGLAASAQPLAVDEPPMVAELAEEDRKAKKAAAAREKRKRKKQASKAATANKVVVASEPDFEAEEDDGDNVDHATTADSGIDVRAVTPTSPILGASHLTDSGTASSDGKVSGISTPASSHGFAAARPSLDWASMEDGDEIPDVEPKQAPVTAAKPILSTEPPFTPRVGRFWGHDERLEGDSRMSPRWKDRSSPAPGDRSSSPFAGSSDGGWQEVTKHQHRMPRVAPYERAHSKNRLALQSTSKFGSAKGAYSSPGMRAWADEEDEASLPITPSPVITPAPTPSPAELANRPPEPPWTARSPVPYLFNVPGSRTFVDDSSKKRTLSLRINVRPAHRRDPMRIPERTLISAVASPAQQHPHPLAAFAEPLKVCVRPGQSYVVYHPAAERERRARDQVTRAAKEAAEQAELERQKLEAEQLRLDDERRAQAEVEAREAALERDRQIAELERSAEEQRRMDAAREMIAAAMPQAMPDESDEQPVASTSAMPMAARPPAGSPQQDEQTATFDAPSAHLTPASMWPPGPFVFAEGMGPPGLHVFDANLNLVVPIDPAMAAQLFPPPPMPVDGTGAGRTSSPADFYSPQSAAVSPQPAFFAPARSSKVEIRAPTPGQPLARSSRRQQSSSSRPSHSPSASRFDVSTPIESIEEHMIPGSYLSGGAVYFNSLPPPGFYMPPPNADFYGASPAQQHTPDMVDPAILRLGYGAPTISA